MALKIRGHAWTLLSRIRDLFGETPDPPSTPWQTMVEDPIIGQLKLTGRLCEVPGADTLLVVVHGLAGNPDRPYCRRAAGAAWRAGISSLRIALRGADLQGEDFYHAGLTEDLAATFKSPEVGAYRNTFLLGYSLGGNVSLRYAAIESFPKPTAVASVCAPLNLQAVGTVMDSTGHRFYRRGILRSLKAIYNAVAARREVPTPTDVTNRLGTFRAWDQHTIVPRFGFDDVDEYYRSMSAGPLLRSLRVPTLLVAALEDPIIPDWTLRPWLKDPVDPLEVRWLSSGGHLGFPRRIDLGQSGPMDLESQIIGWLLSRIPPR